MKLEVRKMSEDITYVGYFSKEYTEYVEVIRCWDRDFTGELRKFYRVDFSYRTVPCTRYAITQVQKTIAYRAECPSFSYGRYAVQ